MLHLHRAERADRLADALAAVLADPLDDPFATELVAVPTRGVERWLSQRLSLTLGTSFGRADGVCANIEFPFPGRIVADAVAAVAGRAGTPDPWRPERAVWPLLEVVHEHLREPWLAPLAAHVDRSGGAPVGLFLSARHLADLFDRYGVHRVDMVRAWARGDDVDGRGEPLDEDLAWQAALWRLLHARIGQPSPAEGLADACRRVRADPALVALPPRLSLFGLTRLAASYLDVLTAIAEAREVHLFLLHPSPVLWQRIADATAAETAETAGGAGSTRIRARADDATARLPRHPLLATWGRDAREMQVVFSAVAGEHDGEHRALDGVTRTLLERIQGDVRNDRAPVGEPAPGGADQRPPLDPGDRSVQVHACHGIARQVEVLRDTILHLLADDPTLQPRDIIVMCPDIDAFTPLIHATFGGGAGPDGPVADDADDLVADDAAPAGPSLTVRLADRSLRQTNPVLAAVSELLELAAGRFSASAVLDFASREPVRRRFRFSDDDLGRIEDWVGAAGVRWGIDGAHRSPFELQQVDANTWRAGLDRVLLGVTMAEEDLRLVGSVLPLDDVDSGDIDLAGRLAELVERLVTAVDSMATAQPIAAWAAAIDRAADLLTTTSDTDRWQRAQLARLLDDIVDEAVVGTPSGSMTSSTALALEDVQALLADRLRGRPTRANFRTGHLTMCTLVPMRSVPHRVVCLLGLDDGVFPRRAVPDGDDLVERDPRVGDGDARSEDRQLLLDALLAATERLVITYQGRDERTNLTRPPAVPLGELLDVIDATVRIEVVGREQPTPAREVVVVAHPLQSFDTRNFTAGALQGDRPWSFDPVALAGARAAAGPRRAARRFLAGPLPPVPDAVIELDDLVRFVEHPVKAFLRQRLDLVLRRQDDDAGDALPIELDALEQWGVGQRMLDARLAGADDETCWLAEIARGELPPGELGLKTLDRVRPDVDRLLAHASKLAPASAHRHTGAVRVDLAGARAVVGTVANVMGDQLRLVTYSKLGPRHRVAAWVRWLALTATEPEQPWCAVTIGRGPNGAVAIAEIRPIGDEPEVRRIAARAQLETLADLYTRGMREPLPIYPKTSAAYALAVRQRKDAAKEARFKWESQRFDNEDRDPAHLLVLGGERLFDGVCEERPGADESGDGWPADESTRFGRYARRLWDPLLSVEKVSYR